MLIGQLVKETGLSKDTIRFYEKQGLITVQRKDRRNNNYKDYPEDILHRLFTIKRLKRFGFTLNEITELLEMIEMNQASCNNVSDKIAQKIVLIDEKINELKVVRRILQRGVAECMHTTTERSSNNCLMLTSDECSL